MRAAINNEVIAATTFNFIPRQDAVAPGDVRGPGPARN